MKHPKLKKEYTRTDLVIFGNYLLSKQREKSIKAGAHYQVDKNALRNVHHADISNAFDNVNVSVLS